MEPTFHFKEGTRIKGGLDAQSVGEELERIRVDHGHLTPQGVVDESRTDDAVLHPCFTWDDATAAEAHRRHEARTITRSLRVVYPDNGESEPLYVHVRKVESEDSNQEGGYYEQARTVVANVSLFDNAWRAAQERLSAAAKALADLENLSKQRKNFESHAITAARSKITEAQDLLQAS